MSQRNWWSTRGGSQGVRRSVVSIGWSALPAALLFGSWCLLLMPVNTLGLEEATKAAPTTRAPARVADVVYVATPHDVVERMLELAGVTKQDVIYDLGCGDGRIVATAGRKYGCRGALLKQTAYKILLVLIDYKKSS